MDKCPKCYQVKCVECRACPTLHMYGCELVNS